VSSRSSEARAHASDLPAVSGLKTRVVELVGLPGTGKTTVVSALVETGQGRIQRVRLRGWRSMVFSARNVFVVAIPFAHQWRRIRGRRWNRFSMMVRLQTLGDLLAPARTRGSEIVLLDQGPVYMLSILQRALQDPDSPTVNSPRFETYWRQTLAAWAERLDCVVQLEASDDVLHQRIIRRGTMHPALRLTAEQAARSFETTRRSRERILRSLQSTASGGPLVVSLRTDLLTIEDTVSEILERLGASAVAR
jgi:adenylate kinase family enzyme